MAGRILAGRRHITPHVAPDGGRKMWNAARVLRRFGVREIAATSEISLSHTEKTLHLWRRAGYLRIDVRSATGPTIFRLVRNSGALPPRHVRASNALLDRNTGELWSLKDGALLGVERRAVPQKAAS